MRQLISLFPASPLTLVIKGFLFCRGVSLVDNEEGEDIEDESNPLDYDSAFQLVLVSSV